jgi:hypothetical protein
MLPYFPLTSDRYEMPMNARAEPGALIQVEADRYREEIALKERIIASDPRYYVQCPPEAEPLAWEALELLLFDMVARLPEHFALERQRGSKGERWTWTNRLLGTVETFTPGDAASLPLPPLDWLGRQVQEDLILMASGADGETVCAAGHLCFAAAWCLDDKIGETFLRVHDPVPEFRERIGTASDQLMRRLKPGRPVSRQNWSVVSTDQLNLAPALAQQWHASRYGITPANVAERIFFRVEHQTLTRLPHTGGVLFTIHTYINPLEDVIAAPARLRRLTAVLRDLPHDLKVYKGMAPYFDVLLAHLEERVHANADL